MHDQSASEPSVRLRRAVAVAVGGGCAVLYALTLCRTVYWYDSAEFAAMAASLGVPHPPGYPLYTLVAHAFTWIPGEPAFGVNVMSAVFGVAAVLLVFWLARRLGANLLGAVFAALLLATGKTFWGNAVVAEVYTPGLVFSLAVVALLERAAALHRPRLVALAGLVGGLGVGMHMSIATLGLGYVWLVVTHDIALRRFTDLRALRDALPRRLYRALTAGLAAVLGLLVFVYVPLVKFEKWNELEWVTFQRNSVGGAFRRKFLQDYDLRERFELVFNVFLENLLWVGLAVALVGMVLAVRRRPRLGVGLALCLAGNSYWFFNYDVPDLDVFFLPAIAIACIFAGFATGALADELGRKLPAARYMGWGALLLPAFLVARNYRAVDLSRDVSAAEFGEAACRSLPKGSRIILFSNPDEWRYYAVFMYVQEALGQCRDVVIWARPGVSAMRRAVGSGKPVYAFERVPRARREFEMVPVTEAGLFKLETKIEVPIEVREHAIGAVRSNQE